MEYIHYKGIIFVFLTYFCRLIIFERDDFSLNQCARGEGPSHPPPQITYVPAHILNSFEKIGFPGQCTAVFVDTFNKVRSNFPNKKPNSHGLFVEIWSPS